MFSRELEYVHILRDGRDAALSYADMAYRPRFSLAYPGWLGDFAASWRREVLEARRLGATVAAAALSRGPDTRI